MSSDSLRQTYPRLNAVRIHVTIRQIWIDHCLDLHKKRKYCILPIVSFLFFNFTGIDSSDWTGRDFVSHRNMVIFDIDRITISNRKKLFLWGNIRRLYIHNEGHFLW